MKYYWISIYLYLSGSTIFYVAGSTNQINKNKTIHWVSVVVGMIFWPVLIPIWYLYLIFGGKNGNKQTKD